jgi:peptidoglycan/LPS O-acetylase OafA/YrhL
MASTTTAATGATPATQSKSRIPELDGLRGIAITLVLIVHYFYLDPGTSHPPEWIKWVFVHLENFAALGWTGVDLFFVLSGFLIGGILLDARGSSNYFKTFYARRAFRILPIYYAWIGAYILVMAVTGGLLATRISGGGTWESGSTMVAQLFFLQNLRSLPYAPIGWAWFAPTWSLAVEEQFYLIVPAVVRFFTKRWLYLCLGFVILAAPLLRLYVRYRFPFHRPAVLSLAYILMPCRADALAAGILTALLWRNHAFRGWLNRHGRVLLVSAAAFFLGVAALSNWAPDHDSLLEQSAGYTWLAIFYALVILLVLSKPEGWLASFTRIGWLRELGRVSYCVYLIHVAVGMFCQTLLTLVLRRVHIWEYLVANGGAVIVSYTIARVSWTYFENPLLQQGHKYKY